MKKGLLTITFALLSIAVSAQDAAKEVPKDGWKTSNQFGVNLAGAGYNAAWQTSQGGFNSTALGFLINLKADLLKGKGMWTNDFQTQYGFIRGQFDKASTSAESRKNIDRLFFETKYARKISGKVNWFAGANLLTQLAKGLDYNKNKSLISNFLTPAVLTEGIGIQWKPVPYFSAELGGATLRQTFVQDADVIKNVGDGGKKPAYGVPFGSKFINDVGVSLVGIFDKDVAKNFNLKARYTGFVVLASSAKTLTPEHKAIDHRLDLVGTAKLGKYINANVTLIGIRDKDINAKAQISRGLNIGLLYSM